MSKPIGHIKAMQRIRREQEKLKKFREDNKEEHEKMIKSVREKRKPTINPSDLPFVILLTFMTL